MAVLARAALDPDVSLANVSFDEEAEVDEREVHVEFVANDNDYARRLLKRWARATAHERLWFADELYEPRALPPVPREATTSCRCCGLDMRDASQSFWDMVQGCGFFPPFCFACGATVPQWLAVRRPSTHGTQRGVADPDPSGASGRLP